MGIRVLTVAGLAVAGLLVGVVVDVAVASSAAAAGTSWSAHHAPLIGAMVGALGGFLRTRPRKPRGT